MLCFIKKIDILKYTIVYICGGWEMNESGIIAQYGFLFQRKVFVLYVLENMNIRKRFCFEGKDDVEIETDEKIYELEVSESDCVQVKSGIVNQECFLKVIGNWLLLDYPKVDTYTLFIENELKVDLSVAYVTDKIIEFAKKGKEKGKTSIAHKVYTKYKKQIDEDDIENLTIAVKAIVEKIKIDKCSMEELDLRLETIFFEKYCSDIVEYDIAKKKRLEKFIQYINAQIDNSIKMKKPYSLVFSELMKLIISVSEEITDTEYKVDVKLLKPLFQKRAKEIVEEKKDREVRQLFLVNSKDEFILRGIVAELFYKDFREVYIGHKDIDISNLEEFAKENFEMVLDELGDDCGPKRIYDCTMARPIESNSLPDGPVYRKGCYIYLTSDEVDEDLQIEWGKDDAIK